MGRNSPKTTLHRGPIITLPTGNASLGPLDLDRCSCHVQGVSVMKMRLLEGQMPMQPFQAIEGQQTGDLYSREEFRIFAS